MHASHRHFVDNVLELCADANPPVSLTEARPHLHRRTLNAWWTTCVAESGRFVEFEAPPTRDNRLLVNLTQTSGNHLLA